MRAVRPISPHHAPGRGERTHGEVYRLKNNASWVQIARRITKENLTLNELHYAQTSVGLQRSPLSAARRRTPGRRSLARPRQTPPDTLRYFKFGRSSPSLILLKSVISRSQTCPIVQSLQCPVPAVRLRAGLPCIRSSQHTHSRM